MVPLTVTERGIEPLPELVDEPGAAGPEAAGGLEDGEFINGADATVEEPAAAEEPAVLGEPVATGPAPPWLGALYPAQPV